MRCFNSFCTLVLCTVMLAGCSTSPAVNTPQANYQEEILLKSKNYGGLIDLYRSWLKKKDDLRIRQKLASYYAMAGDAESSLYYLRPLMSRPTLPLLILQAQNQIALGQNAQAIETSDKMIQIQPQGAEAWNLRGIALTMNGQPEEGKRAIEKARSLFIADEVALNNLAMLAMIEHRYKDAVALLLPQYRRGHRQQQLVHNLVLSLVKSGETRYARDILRDEKLSSNPEALTEALMQLTVDGTRRMG